MKLVSDSGFREKTCPQCGKKFFCYTDTWVLTRFQHAKWKVYFCTWSCLKKYDEEREQKRKRKRRGKYG